MSMTITLNFSITVNPIPLFINLVLIYSSVAEEGRCHDNIVNPVNGSVWRGFRMFHVLMFAATVALVAIAALLLLVIRKDKSNYSRIGDGPSLPLNNVGRSYLNNGVQILSGAINTTGDINGTASVSLFFIKKWINLSN